METIPEPFLDQPPKPLLWSVPGVVLIISDLHIPYHDPVAIESALSHITSYCQSNRKSLKAILINGDGIDCYELSDYQKTKGRPTYYQETQELRKFIKHLQKRFPKTIIIYKIGNHENRIERYLAKNAPELDHSVNSLKGMVGFEELGVKLIEDKQVLWLGKQAVLHGHEFSEGRYAPANIAKSLFEKTLCDSLCGHHHRTDRYLRRNLAGHTIRCNTVGCLAQLMPEYKVHNQYNHGFAITEIMPSLDYHCENMLIINGVVR